MKIGNHEEMEVLETSCPWSYSWEVKVVEEPEQQEKQTMEMCPLPYKRIGSQGAINGTAAARWL